MYYEIYVDSLLLVNLVMNLFCLELVNLLFFRTATRRRIFLAASFGAIFYLIPFWLPGPAWLKMAVFFPISTTVMILSAFRIRQFSAFLNVTGGLFIVSFVIGGGLLFLIEKVSFLRTSATSMFGIMITSALIFVEVSHFIQKKKDTQLCRVELFGMGARIKVIGLIDSGNGLVEPISGQPVCVMDKNTFKSLWKTGGPGGFRVIPYHSVGKNRGILYGYLIPEMRIERNGIICLRKNIYIGVSEESVSKEGGYCLIVPPDIF